MHIWSYTQANLCVISNKIIIIGCPKQFLLNNNNKKNTRRYHHTNGIDYTYEGS